MMKLRHVSVVVLCAGLLSCPAPIDLTIVSSMHDTIAPVIQHLRVWPVTAATRIQAGTGSHVLRPAEGVSGAQPPVRVTGPPPSTKSPNHGPIESPTNPDVPKVPTISAIRLVGTVREM